MSIYKTPDEKNQGRFKRVCNQSSRKGDAMTGDEMKTEESSKYLKTERLVEENYLDRKPDISIKEQLDEYEEWVKYDGCFSS